MNSDLLDEYSTRAAECAEEAVASENHIPCPAGHPELISLLSPRSVKRELPGGVTGALGIHLLALLFLWAGPLFFARVDLEKAAFMVSLVDLDPGAGEKGGGAEQRVDGGSTGLQGIAANPAGGNPQAEATAVVDSPEPDGPVLLPWEPERPEGREITEEPPEAEVELVRHEQSEPLPVTTPPAAAPVVGKQKAEKPEVVPDKRSPPQKPPGVARDRKQARRPGLKSAVGADPDREKSSDAAVETAKVSAGGGEGEGVGQGMSKGEGKSGERGSVPPQHEFQLAQVDTPPTVVSRVEPDYPAVARRKRLSGKLVVKFLVDPDGRVRKASVLQAAPQGVFESCVLDAMVKWRFKPGVYRGRPVSTWVILPIQFQVSG